MIINTAAHICTVTIMVTGTMIGSTLFQARVGTAVSTTGGSQMEALSDLI